MGKFIYLGQTSWDMGMKASEGANDEKEKKDKSNSFPPST